MVSGICLTEEDKNKLEIVQVSPENGGQTTYGVLMREGKHIDAALKGLLPLDGGVGGLNILLGSGDSKVNLGDRSYFPRESHQLAMCHVENARLQFLTTRIETAEAAL